MNEQLAAAIEEAERAGTRRAAIRAVRSRRDRRHPASWSKTLRKEFGPIYGLVNNAALGTDGALAIMHNSQIEQLVRVNTLVARSC